MKEKNEEEPADCGDAYFVRKASGFRNHAREEKVCLVSESEAQASQRVAIR